jgi:hypothetical protein
VIVSFAAEAGPGPWPAAPGHRGHPDPQTLPVRLGSTRAAAGLAGSLDGASTSAISQARTRLGEAPLKLLFARIAVPMARPGTRSAWFHGLRVMAIDGLVLNVPDTPNNNEQFGRSGNDTAPGPFPPVRLVDLGECGTHAVVDAVLGPVTTDERSALSPRG